MPNYHRALLSFLACLVLLAAGMSAVSCVSGASSSGTAVSLDRAIQSAAEDIGNNAQAGQKIAVLNFSSPSDRLSEYVIEELSDQLVNGRKLVVVTRRELDLIRQEEVYQMSGEVSDESAQAIGKKLGAQLIASGSLSPLGASYRFRIRALNVETAAIEAAISMDLRPGDPKITSLLYGPPSPAPAVPKPAQPAAPPAAAPAVSPVVSPAPPQRPDTMVRINGGTFLMGSPGNEIDRDSGEVQHRVTVSSFSMGKNPVTLGEFRGFADTSGYRTDAEKSGGGAVWTSAGLRMKREVSWKNPDFNQEENYPVVLISWYDAVQYCNWLSAQEGKTPAYSINGTDVTWNRNASGYRLPTEAEWEYACRAGNATPFNTGSNITTSQANYNGNNPYNNNPAGEFRQRTTAVGSFAANSWGLCDMHGNVWE